MGIFFVYILKSSVCLAVFYLFYRLLLSRETFHRFNRVALLSILLLSCLLPLVEVTVEEQTEVHQTMMTLEQWLMLADMMNTADATGGAGGRSDGDMDTGRIVDVFGWHFVFCFPQWIFFAEIGYSVKVGQEGTS